MTRQAIEGLFDRREFLDAAARGGLADVDATAAVDAHAVRPQHLADMTSAVTEGADDFQVAAPQNPDLVIGAVGQVEPLLIVIRRQHRQERRARRARLGGEDLFGDVGALLIEHLEAVATAIRDVDAPVSRARDAMHGRKLLIRRFGIVGIFLRVIGRLAVCAPVAQVLSSGGLEHDDAPVAIAVGDERFVRFWINPDARGSAKQRRVVAAGVLVHRANRQHMLAFARELHHAVMHVRTDPHEVVVIDEDAMWIARPLRHVLRAVAERAHDLARRIEFEHCWRGLTAFAERRLLDQAELFFGQRLRQVRDPDMLARIHVYPGHRTQDPVVRQLERPRRIDAETRRRLTSFERAEAHGSRENGGKNTRFQSVHRETITRRRRRRSVARTVTIGNDYGHQTRRAVMAKKARKPLVRRVRKTARPDTRGRAAPARSVPTPAQISPAEGLTIVGVGASAGGLEAFTQLLESLDSDAGITLVLVQHLSPHHDSALVSLLAPHTGMPVVEATEGVRLQRDHVYVIPPNAQMVLDGSALHLTPRPGDRTAHTPIDSFFTSLAAAARDHAIAVVLSGTASDGAVGIRDVKAAGGITFAQTPASAKFDGMPRAAIATGVVDVTLTPSEIGGELSQIARHPYSRRPMPGDGAAPADEDLSRVFEILQPASGVDFRHYKLPTVRRRVLRRMALHRIPDIKAYIKLLASSSEEAQGLFQDLLIHVTSFFREPDSFDALAAEVFPRLIGRDADRPIRAWVCGCATGEEAYSLAIALLEFLQSKPSAARVQIFATDVSETAVVKARAGVYPASIAADVGPERLRRFFTRTDGQYRVSKQIRDLCVFARQDLTKDPPFSRLDLVMCRNVLIYMNAVLQRKLISMFHYALVPDGHLMLG